MSARLALGTGLLACILAASHMVAQDLPTRQPPTREQIAQAIDQLADERFRVREAASALLWKAGIAAREALEAAAKSDDPERAQRAESILARVRLGILPDTPPDVVKLIHQFRDSTSSSVRRRVIQQLSRSERFDTVLALIRSETDEKKRAYLVRAITRDINKLLEEMLARREIEEVEQILEMSAIADSTQANYAVYLTLSGKADKEIERLRAAPHTVSSTHTRLLIALLKLKGDLSAARTLAAEVAGDNESAQSQLVEPIAFAQRDWSALAKRRSASIAKPNRRTSVDTLSLDAAYLMLGGEPERFEKAIDALKAHAAATSSAAWFCAEALLICGRQDEAVDLLTKHRPTAAFSLLVAQGRYADAFELAEIAVPFADGSIAAVETTKPDGSTSVDFYYSARVAKALYQIGEQQRSLELFDKLAALPTDDGQRHRAYIAQQLMKLNRQKEAFRHAALAIEATEKDTSKADAELARVLRGLFEAKANNAVVCWKHFRVKHADESHTDRLVRLQRLLLPTEKERGSDDTFADFRSEVDRILESTDMKLDDAGRIVWLRTLSSICDDRDMTEPARSYYEKLAELETSGDACLKVADLRMKQKNFKQASKWYEKARERKHRPPLTMFLQGHTLVQAGDTAEGQALMKLARLLPLGDTRQRYDLYKGLDDRSLRSLAKPDRELVVRLGSLHDWHANNAAKELGNDISKTHPLEAADHWQQSALSVLRTNSSFLDVSAYLRLPHIIHKVRARGLIAAGRHEAAVHELWRSHRALPGDIDLALDMIPTLREAKLDKVADELFEKIYAVNNRTTLDFPDSAFHHNTVAWLAARCQRRTDDALAHAEAAVRLAPDRAAYLDTLAEVHFVRGNKAKAIELARRCIQMEPEHKIFRDQLKRFEQ